MGRDVGPDELTDVGQWGAALLVLVGDVVACRVRHPHPLAPDSSGELLGGLRHMGVGAEEDVDLPGVGQGLGVGDLLVVGGGLILLAELGMDDDEVGARRTGRLRRLRDGATSLSDTEYPVGSSRPLRSMVVEIWATVTVRPPRSSS